MADPTTNDDSSSAGNGFSPPAPATGNRYPFGGPESWATPWDYGANGPLLYGPLSQEAIQFGMPDLARAARYYAAARDAADPDKSVGSPLAGQQPLNASQSLAANSGSPLPYPDPPGSLLAHDPLLHRTPAGSLLAGDPAHEGAVAADPTFLRADGIDATGSGGDPFDVQPFLRPSDVLEVPSYKKDIFKSPEQQRAWNRFNWGVHYLPDASDLEKSAYPDIFAAEGGIKPNGTTVAGITADKLHELKDRIPGVTQNTLPKDLTPQQQAQFYRAYLDNALKFAGGRQALENRNDPGAARYIADTLFREGESGGATMIRSALNKMPESNDASNGGAIQASGPIDQDTITAMQKVLQSPDSRQTFLENLYGERRKKHNDREWQRNRYFFQKAFDE